MASPRLLWVLWLLLWHAGSIASGSSALPVHQVSVGEDGTPQPVDQACSRLQLLFKFTFSLLQVKVDGGIACQLSQPAGASSAHGPQLNAVACGPEPCSCQHKNGACDGESLHHRPESTSLHNFVYNGDFAGFKKALSQLAQHEHFPHLLGALQMNDAQVRWAGFPRWYLQWLGCTSELLLACHQWSVAAYKAPWYQEHLHWVI
jgi:hypothetical protein